jgi:hypothetical protein
MAAHACGCALRDKAAADPDPRGAKILDAQGANLQRAWRCPRAEGRCPEEIPPAAREVIVRVTRLVGEDPNDPVPEFTTCPCWYLRTPDAHVVERLLPWFDKGQLVLREPHPSAVLVEAIDFTQRSLSMRQADDLRRIREKPEDPKGTKR